MKRKIAAIMAADIAGYSKLVAEDEEETLRRLAAYRAVIDDFIAKAGGRIFNTAGDAVLAEFPSAVEAVRCAIDVQESLRTRNLAYPPSRQMNFRIGITIGDVVERDGDLLGDGVNIAARLEGLAQVGGICVSRAVHEQVANKLSVRFDDIGEQQVKNIPTPVYAYMLQLRTEDVFKPASPPKKPGPAARWKWPIAVALAGAGALTAAAVYLPLASYLPAAWTTQHEPPPPAAKNQKASAPRLSQRQAEVLVPETVPFISERDRAQIRAVYLSAPDRKALAVSSAFMGFITGQPDDEIAKSGAVDACQRTTDAANVRSRCELYAVGNTVVSTRAHPPLPPQPWVARNPAIEKSFAVAEVPLVGDAGRKEIERDFVARRKPKALALSPRGSFAIYFNVASIEEAVRRSLERCGSNGGVACMIIAVDDVFVVPIPTSMKVVGFVLSGAINAIAPESRDEVARRLGNATGGWNAVAVGAGGRPGVMLGAATEPAAIAGAMADCGRQDHTCRVVALGPFLVEPGSPNVPTVATAPVATPPASPNPAPSVSPNPAPPASQTPAASKYAALLTFLSTAVPPFAPSFREDVVRRYEARMGHKAFAFVPGATKIYFTGDQSSSQRAEELVLEKCQAHHGLPCALLMVNEEMRPAPADGRWPTRDMPRARYDATFDPERIPAVGDDIRRRQDVAGYRNAAAAPKAAAFHAWGRIFIATAAANQRAAEEKALADCNADPTRRGEDGPCFLYAVGDQVVLPQRRTAPLTSASAPAAVTTTPAPAAPSPTPSVSAPAASQAGSMIASLISATGLTPAAREDLVKKYEALRDHKALAAVPGTSRNWRTGGWGNAARAEEVVLEACQAFHNQPCAVMAINDKAQAPPTEGRWPTRDMPRVHYAGTFDPEHIPAVSVQLRARSDITGYRTAPGPKAAAFHPWGRVFVATGAASQRAAEARVLLECNSDPTRAGQDPPCYLYAVGDQVVLPQRRTEPVTSP